jgi:hypothetical protein
LKKKNTQAKSLWQMHGAGVVGGQSMLGITAVKALSESLSDSAKIWPFETGFGALDLEALDGVSTVMAEVYPSLFELDAQPGEVRDATQVRVTATAFAEMDDRGEMAALFAAPKGLDEAQTAIAAEEEGWILGV